MMIRVGLKTEICKKASKIDVVRFGRKSNCWETGSARISRHGRFPTSASCGEAEGREADAEEPAELGGGVAVASGCSAMGDDKATERLGGDSTGRAKQDAPPGRRWRIRRRYFCVLIHVAISGFKYHQLVARLIGAMKIRSFRSSAGSTSS